MEFSAVGEPVALMGVSHDVSSEEGNCTIYPYNQGWLGLNQLKKPSNLWFFRFFFSFLLLFLNLNTLHELTTGPQ